MANTYSPFGANDLMHWGGSQRTEELETAWIKSSDATPIFYGDLVVSSTVAAASGGVANYIQQGSSIATPTNLGWRGVFRGCYFWNNAVQKMVYSRYYPGQGVTGTTSVVGGDVRAYIVSDPNQRFLMQASTGTTLTAANIGMLFPVLTSAASSAVGNTTTGQSGLALASSTATLPSSAASFFGATPMPFKLVDFYANYAPGNWMQVPFAGTSAISNFINGTDNSTSGQIVVVTPYDWEDRLV